MMFSTQSTYRNRCSLLSVSSRKVSHDDDKKKQLVTEDRYPLPELTSSGRLEVNVLNEPDPQDFQRSLEAVEPNFLYLQGYRHEDSEEIGPLVWKNVEISDPEALCSLFGSKLPTTVYLEIPDGEEFAEALQSKGIRYVIYWKGGVSVYAAAHFRQALVSVVQSSCSHTWDAFQLAEASYRLYCAQNDDVTLSPDSENPSSLSGPQLLGDPPTIDIVQPEADAEGEEDSQESLSSVKIYDDDVSMRFLACGMPHTLDGHQFLRSLEDGINALLRIEVRGSKLHNRVSAPPPPLQAGTFSRGVVTMRCDFSTCTAAHISLLVSGNAQTCFSDQLLENHVKNELIENNRPAHALPSCEEMNPSSSFEPRKSAAIACGASVFEVCMKLPAWASQILKQLAPDVSYRSLVALGIGSIQGLPVASFDKDDAARLLFLSARQGGGGRGGSHNSNNTISTTPPSWLKPPPPIGRKRSEELCEKSKPLTTKKQRTMMNSAAMRPIPHVRSHRRMLPFNGLSEIERHEAGSVRPNMSIVSVKQSISGTPPIRKSSNSNHSSLHAQQMIALNPLPLKKHGCDRSPIQNCSEEEFLRDVMEFLILRGHTRLVPQGGLPEFPDAVLNAKRLDLFNLYREVVTRGGFNVGNGINWKGQVFSRMRNYTLTNRMTGVGNTLKRHYETYLLEYELAHDDVGGECCLLCHSSAAGDWVNCGICDEWAHFGCDRRQGLGAFKDYAKTDGLEYICPNCSTSNFRKKSQKAKNGY